MRRIRTFGRYFREKFGENVCKVPVSIMGFTCPNIDGTVAKGGCTFCLNESFSPNLTKTDTLRFRLGLASADNPFLQKQLEQLEAQFFATQKKLRATHGAEKFIVYFQSYTNTYAPLSTLRSLWERALALAGVIGISVGTRTDAITEETLDLLALLSKKHEIWVEYGIQSIYDETLHRINRGHDSKNVQEWIAKTKKKGLKVCGHVIFGLPGETQKMMLETIKAAVAWGIDAIKIHPLYVVKGTILASEYQSGKFVPISEELYIDTLIKALGILPPNMIVQRVTAGIDDETLLAPEWCKSKPMQMKKIRKALRDAGYLY